MRNYTFYNHYDVVYGGYGWHKYFANNKLINCRTCQEAERDGQCKRCNYDTKPHFLVEENPGEYVKLCIIDVIKHRPIDFKMSIFDLDIQDPITPRKHEQLKLFN